jgi:hypothetical protein
VTLAPVNAGSKVAVSDPTNCRKSSVLPLGRTRSRSAVPVKHAIRPISELGIGGVNDRIPTAQPNRL